MPDSLTPSLARARVREAAWSATATLVALLAVAAIQGCEDVNVTAIDVAEIEVQPEEGSLLAGDSLPLVAVLRDAVGNPLTNRPVSWSSDDPSVASVRSDGMVTGVALGVTRIRASAGQAQGTATITVVQVSRITLSEKSVRFETRPGSAPPASRAVEIENGGGGQLSDLAFAVSYPSGEPEGWLAVSLAGTTAPTSLTLSASTSGLGAGVYRADVEIRSPGAENSPEVLEVELVVGGGGPVIALAPSALGFAAEVGQTAPPSHTVQVENSGGGELGGLDVSISYEGLPTGWLGASLNGDAAPTDLVVSVALQGLVAGVYEASVLVTSAAASNSPRAVPVRLTVGGSPARIKLDPGSVNFEVTANGSTPSSRSVRVENDGGGSLGGLSASVSYGSGASGWLEAELGSSSAPTDLTLSVSETDLSPGTYRATVGVRSPNAANSPQSVTVRLKVEEGESPARIKLDPGSVNFEVTANGSTPSSRTVRVESDGGGSLGGLSASVSYGSGASGWLEAELGSSSAPTDLKLSVTKTDLKPGTYEATVRVRSSQAANSPRTVTVRLVVTPGVEGSARVTAVTYRTTGGPNGDRHLRVTVSVREGDGRPVGNVRVIAAIRNRSGHLWIRTGRTGDDGDVTFPVNNHPPGCYVTTVTGVDTSDLHWDGNTPANEYYKS
jgi:hypothetical protein